MAPASLAPWNWAKTQLVQPTPRAIAKHIDVNKGGFIITIAEMCFKNKLGVNLDLSNCFDDNLRDDEILLSESVGRFVLETESKEYDKIMQIAKIFNAKIKKVGCLISNPEINIKGLNGKKLKLDIKKMKELYESTIPSFMEI